MASDRDRERRLRRERSAAAKALPRIQRDTAGEVRRLLERARKDVQAAIAEAAPASYQALSLRALERSVDEALAAFGRDAGAAAAAGQRRAWTAGVETVDRPLSAALSLDAAPVDLSAILPEVDTGQLEAMREFLTTKMRAVGTDLADRINTELGLTVIGSRNVSDAIGAVQRLTGSGRKRAFTVVRTEVGRAYSVAGQARMAQAAEMVPGLKKQWRRSGKVHSRLTHDLADGQVQRVDEPFRVSGGRLMFPRDPAGPPGETINCGCQSLPWMEHWDVRTPGRLDYTPEELALDPRKRDLAGVLAGDRPKDLDGWIAVGRERREAYLAEVGRDPDSIGFSDRFRAALRRDLADQRSAGTVAANIDAAPGGKAAAARVRAAAKDLPAEWIVQANHFAVEAKRPGPRGKYQSGYRGTPARIVTRGTDAGVALHEYVHHVQVAMPRLNGLFHALHRRRTAGEPRLPVSGDPDLSSEIGRRDKYVDPYTGREYGDEERPLEVLTTGIQQLFHPVHGRDLLRVMAKKDPEMLDMLLGVLFRYDLRQ